MFLNLISENNRRTFLYMWLQNIYGIGVSRAKKICNHFNYNINIKIGDLSSFDIFELRKHIESSYDLDSVIKREVFLNITHLKRIRTYRGLRHYENLPVRGQRTHNNAQTQKKMKRNSLLRKN